MKPIQNVQAMRGVAAGMVFVGHLFTTQPTSFGSRFFWLGPTGVDIFFVISGFIICLTATGSALQFAKKRFLRIYPLYWAALAFAWLVSPFIRLSPETTPIQHPLRLILLATVENDKVAVAWTLAYEVYFYAIVTVLLAAFGRHLFRAIAVWMGVQTIAVAITYLMDPRLLYWPPLSPLIFEFGLGCGVAALLRRRVALPPFAALMAGCIWFALGLIVNCDYGRYAPLPRALCFGPGAALIIHALVTLEDRLVLPRLLQRLGDASYSLYLWHQMIFIVASFLFPHWIWLWAVLGLGAGLLSHWACNVHVRKPPDTRVEYG